MPILSAQQLNIYQHEKDTEAIKLEVVIIQTHVIYRHIYICA